MTPKERYRRDLRRPGFEHDPEQARAVEALDTLYHRLLEPPPKPTLWQRLRGERPGPVRGLYLWGGVGRGKTYLMDTFFDCIPFEEKERLHFHRFMQQIHEQLKKLPKTPDPLPIVAHEVARRVRLLCLDEFFVHDIGDAMLLAGFLEALFENGVTLVTTSNVAPRDLYRNGLQRQRFEPAIELIERHTETVALGHGRDYRSRLLEQAGTYHVERQAAAARERLAAQWRALVPNAVAAPRPLAVNHRTIDAEALADGVAWFDFEALCATPRSAADYLEIARTFPTLLLGWVPVLDESRDDVAQRFIHLIDALYDHNVKLVVAAADYPPRLYTGQRHAFSFQRTVSRLVEMGSEAYLGQPHRAA